MKRTLSLFLVNVIVILSLFTTFGVLGLQREEQEEQERFTGILERNATLRILENDTAKDRGYLKEILDAFNEEYAEYGITAVDANMGEYTNLEQLGPAGYGPDIVYQANNTLMNYAENKHIQPLPIDDLEIYPDIPEQAWDAFQSYFGATEYTFAIPVNIQEPVLYYRKDLLPENWQTEWDDDKNGIPDMVENWSDLYAFSAQIKKDSGGNKYGYMKSLTDQYFAAGYFLSYGGYIFGQDEETGEFDTKDIGLSAGESYKGARIIRQLTSIMDNKCTDDTITTTAYELLGNGTYFATMTTPDVYETFVENFTKSWKRTHKDWTDEEVDAYVRENLVMTKVPELPVSGDLNDRTGETFEMTVMGGIHGYAISSYTKYPNAALAFIEFATQYEWAERRSELLGTVPARTDAVNNLGGLSQTIYDDLMNEKIYVMPGERAMSQVWPAMQSLLTFIVQDGLQNGNAYSTDEKLIAALKELDRQIYDAIHTLS